MSDKKVELQALQCDLGVLQRADGSARVVQGKTAVLCAVYGPAEVKASKERPEKAVVEVVVNPESGMSGPRERVQEHLLTSCCEAVLHADLHPHTAISLTLQVERDAGGLLSVLFHACCLGLLDACLPMASTFTALTCGISQQGEMVPQPTPLIEKDCSSLLTVVIDSTSGDIITSHTSGSFSIDQLQRCISAAKESAKTTTAFYRQVIRRKLSKDAKFSELNIAV